MKKIYTFLAAVALCGTMNAQFIQTMKNLDIFNHLGLGVGIGTTGITVDAGTTITPWVQLRAGVDIMPSFKLKSSLALEQFGVDPQMGGMVGGYPVPQLNEFDIEGKLTNTTGHFLFDIFPVTKLSSFHITVGGYFGGNKFISAYNTSGQDELKDVYNYNHRLGRYSMVPLSEGKIGAALGDYFIEPDDNGHVEASIKVWRFRPYVGIGFGRIVPNSRINCLFDLGVQFWGSPQVWDNYERLTSEGADGSDGGIIKTISKVSVYPVLSVKLVGRIL